MNKKIDKYMIRFRYSDDFKLIYNFFLYICKVKRCLKTEP